MMAPQMGNVNRKEAVAALDLAAGATWAEFTDN